MYFKVLWCRAGEKDRLFSRKRFFRVDPNQKGSCASSSSSIAKSDAGLDAGAL